MLDTWPAAADGPGRWDVPSLLQRFGGQRLKVGSDDEGYAVRLSLEHYCHYLTSPT